MKLLMRNLSPGTCMGGPAPRPDTGMNARRRPRDSGQSFVMTAICLTVLVGFAGLAADVGYMFHQRRRMQTAADSAAMAGALQVYRGASDYQAAGWADATTNGFANGVGGVVVTVNNPPQSGYYAGSTRFVEASISQSEATMFMGVLGFPNRLVRARAVAGPGPGVPDCLLLLSQTAHPALTISGGTAVNVPGCNVTVNSSNSSALTVSGGSTLNAGAIDVTGGVGNSTGFSPAPVTGVPPEPDPFASLQPPTYSGCDHSGLVKVHNATTALNPGTYCAGITIDASSHATFNPGLYIVSGGDLKVSGNLAYASGSGVTFYVVSGGVVLQGGPNVDLAAPTSGTWEGMLFYQDRADTNGATLSGGSNANLTGVLYFPSASVTYSGGSGGSSPYTVIVADTATFSGASSLNSDFSSLSDGSPIKRVTLAE